jgi:hypothetical protein
VGQAGRSIDKHQYKYIGDVKRSKLPIIQANRTYGNTNLVTFRIGQANKFKNAEPSERDIANEHTRMKKDTHQSSLKD